MKRRALVLFLGFWIGFFLCATGLAIVVAAETAATTSPITSKQDPPQLVLQTHQRGLIDPLHPLIATPGRSTSATSSPGSHPPKPSGENSATHSAKPTQTQSNHTTHAPRGSIALIHLVLDQTQQSPNLKPPHISFQTSNNALAQNWLNDAQITHLVPVPVEQNTGLHSRTERFEGIDNPHVIAKAPFWIFEAHQPYHPTPGSKPLKNNRLTDGTAQDEPLTTDPKHLTGQPFFNSQQSVFAIQVSIPPQTPAGHYTLQIQAQTQSQSQSQNQIQTQNQNQSTFHWHIHVHAADATAPKHIDQTKRFANWIHPGNIYRWHHTGWFDEHYFNVLKNYATLTAHIRQNVIPVPINDFLSLQNDQLHFDTQMATRWVNTFTQAYETQHPGAPYWLELMHLAKRPDGQWRNPYLNIWHTQNRTQSPEGQADLAALLPQLQTWLDDLNNQHPNLAGTYLHLADEPTDTNADAYAKLAKQVKKQLPSVQIFDATLSRKLTGAIDAWCPQAHRWASHRDFFDQRQKLGDEVWFYTCLEPGGPWLNRMLDMHRLRPVYLHWACFEFGFDGYLHWALNHWIVDPYQQSVLRHPHDRNPRNWLPAGDTHLVYPPTAQMLASGHHAPLHTTRSHAHRMGMEDLAMLMRLAEYDPITAHRLSRRLVSHLDDFDSRVSRYRQTRLELMQTLETTTHHQQQRSTR